eukprot:gene3165-13179_t
MLANYRLCGCIEGGATDSEHGPASGALAGPPAGSSLPQPACQAVQLLALYCQCRVDIGDGAIARHPLRSQGSGPRPERRHHAAGDHHFSASRRTRGPGGASGPGLRHHQDMLAALMGPDGTSRPLVLEPVME